MPIGNVGYEMGFINFSHNDMKSNGETILQASRTTSPVHTYEEETLPVKVEDTKIDMIPVKSTQEFKCITYVVPIQGTGVSVTPKSMGSTRMLEDTTPLLRRATSIKEHVNTRVLVSSVANFSSAVSETERYIDTQLIKC